MKGSKPSVSGFEDEWQSPDDVFAAVEDAYAENPGEMTARLIEEASRDQFDRLQPAIDAVVEKHRERLFDANTAEAVAAMESVYGDAWKPYAPAIGNYIDANPDVFSPEVKANAQLLAERIQSAYRTVKPQVDAEKANGEWGAIRQSYREYADPISRDS